MFPYIARRRAHGNEKSPIGKIIHQDRRNAGTPARPVQIASTTLVGYSSGMARRAKGGGSLVRVDAYKHTPHSTQGRTRSRQSTTTEEIEAGRMSEQQLAAATAPNMQAKATTVPRARAHALRDSAAATCLLLRAARPAGVGRPARALAAPRRPCRAPRGGGTYGALLVLLHGWLEAGRPRRPAFLPGFL